MMRRRHVTHLLTRYVSDQLRPAQRAVVINHVRTCPACRAALAREERLAADVQREFAHFGQASAGQLSHVWMDVWEEIGPARAAPSRRGLPPNWLPGVSVVLAMLVVIAIAVPLLVESGIRAEAAPLQPRPISTSSPTPGVTDDPPAGGMVLAASDAGAPRATVAFAVEVGASPAPMPEATVSPEAGLGVPGKN